MRIDQSFTAATDLREAMDSLREACAILYATKLPSDLVWSDYADPTRCTPWVSGEARDARYGE